MPLGRVSHSQPSGAAGVCMTDTVSVTSILGIGKIGSEVTRAEGRRGERTQTNGLDEQVGREEEGGRV